MVSLFSSCGENNGSGMPSLKCNHCHAVTMARTLGLSDADARAFESLLGKESAGG